MKFLKTMISIRGENEEILESIENLLYEMENK